MKRLFYLILLLLLSACTTIQFPEHLKFTEVKQLSYVNDETVYFFKEEDSVFLITEINQSEPTSFNHLINSLEYFLIEIEDEIIDLTLFKEKDDYFIQKGSLTYRLNHTFYPNLLKYKENADVYKMNVDQKEVVQINNQLYLKTKRTSNLLPTCGTYDGIITSTISNKYLPNKENEANFNCLNSPYMHHLEDTYIILINEEWFILQPVV